MMVPRVVAVVLVLNGLVSALSGPNDRQPTDPKSVTSVSNPNAKSVAVEDLYVTRLIDSAALSPDGAEVAVRDVIAFSPDNRTVYANHTSVGFDAGDIYAVEIASGKQANLTPHEGKQLNFGADVSLDSGTILMTSNQKGGFQNVALLDVTTKKLTWVTDTQWEATAGAFAQDGGHFTYAVNADGRSDLYLGARQGESARVSLPPGVNSTLSPQQFSPDGRHLLVEHEAMNTPNDLWVYGIDTQRAQQLSIWPWLASHRSPFRHRSSCTTRHSTGRLSPPSFACHST